MRHSARINFRRFLGIALLSGIASIAHTGVASAQARDAGARM